MHARNLHKCLPSKLPFHIPTFFVWFLGHTNALLKFEMITDLAAQQDVFDVWGELVVLTGRCRGGWSGLYVFDPSLVVRGVQKPPHTGRRHKHLEKHQQPF